MSTATTTGGGGGGGDVVEDSRQVIDIMHQINEVLECGLDRTSIALMIGLCETGANPEAVACVLRELRTVNNHAATTTITTKQNNNDSDE
jgi:mitotic-spindle organizing protein 1